MPMKSDSQDSSRTACVYLDFWSRKNGSSSDALSGQFRVVDILQNWTFCIVDICMKTVSLQVLKLNG
jgi:hypothetical protein